MNWLISKAQTLTEDNANQGEDYQLWDYQERKVSRDNGAIHVRLSKSTHKLRQPAHDDWQEERK